MSFDYQSSSDVCREPTVACYDDVGRSDARDIFYEEEPLDAIDDVFGDCDDLDNDYLDPHEELDLMLSDDL